MVRCFLAFQVETADADLGALALGARTRQLGYDFPHVVYLAVDVAALHAQAPFSEGHDGEKIETFQLDGCTGAIQGRERSPRHKRDRERSKRVYAARLSFRLPPVGAGTA